MIDRPNHAFEPSNGGSATPQLSDGKSESLGIELEVSNQTAQDISQTQGSQPSNEGKSNLLQRGKESPIVEELGEMGDWVIINADAHDDGPYLWVHIDAIGLMIYCA